MQKLLLADWLQDHLSCDQKRLPALQFEVQGLSLDSRSLQSGEVFVALHGHQYDAYQFIEAAIAKGAAAVLIEGQATATETHIRWQQDCPLLEIPQLRLQLSQLSCQIYPVDALSLLAITGTNGKTTISQLIAQWLQALDQKAVVMGTTGNGFLDDLQRSANTTADAISLCKQLADFGQQGARYAALEVSSHGLVQHRVRGLRFDVAVMTNLTRDHLDYHGSMQEYAAAKLSLFTEHNTQLKVINIDDETGYQWAQQLSNVTLVSLDAQKAKTFAAQHGTNALWASDCQFTTAGMTLTLDGSWGKWQLSAPLIGRYNANNLLLACATLLLLGYPMQRLTAVSSQLRSVLGRMELFERSGQPKIVVDYAHTPDALQAALTALRVHCQGQLWVIVGCGGERDQGKRPLMARAAEQYADHVILTHDNPRGEDPQQIIEQMLAGLQAPEQATIEGDRYQACAHAFEQGRAQDIILLAGKGHECEQIFAQGSRYYSDRETAQQLLGLPT